MANTVRVGVGVTGAKGASSELDQLKDKFTKLQSQGAKGLISGVAAGATVAAFSLVGQAASQAGQFIMDATDAALEEEASIQKLGTSLRANVADWDGNTDAIEKVLQARMKLGFSDDEQRDSLAKLLGATHDVNKALEIQRTAMDLARLKGISLADAGDALIKVEAGSYRILKSLGIVLKDGATQTEALAAVQKVAAGQAADYAETNAGKLLTSQVQVGEAMEKFGAVTMPAVVAATQAGASAITAFTNVLDIVDGKFPDTVQGAEESTKSIFDLGSMLPFAGAGFGLLGKAAEENMTATADATDVAGAGFERLGKVADDTMTATADATDVATDRVKDDMAVTNSAVRGFASETHTMSDKVTGYLHDVEDAFIATTRTIISDAFDPIETKLDAQADHYEVVAGIEALALAKTKKEHLDAKRDIIRDLDSEANHLLDLGKDHTLTKKQVERFSSDVKAAYNSMGHKVPPQIQKVIHKLNVLADFDGKHVHIDVDISQRVGIGGKVAGKHKAAGGAVGNDGGPTLVGETGPEVVDLPNGSYVHNAQQTKQMLGKGGGNVTYVVNVMGNLTAKNTNEVVAAMHRLKAVTTHYPIPGVIPHG